MVRRGIDKDTKDWIRNASDERAVRAGCRFDPSRGQFVVDWIQKYCRLYEGEKAGEPMILDDWQHEAVMRLFSWVKYSKDWGREIRRFKRGSVWIPKKNGKSPSLAAIGLYLLCGDGELGQKVYSTARDGKQAWISHQHAIEMVNASDALRAECTVSKSTGQITHEPTRSFYRIINGDNINSQEGLNGSILVDETHVVDRRLMDVLRGAGISRSEPLQLQVSTAGNNPDSYGKEQFEYGAKVESGEFIDEEYFYLAYAAPQDLSDADLDRDPAKWGKLCNPTWGRIIKESEFLASYAAAKNSLADLANFKMYRLNIWQKTASPWLRSSDWARCRQKFTEEDLKGQPCWAGLDLSKTQDMSSLVLTFREEEPDHYKILPYFWMPEKAAQERNHLASFLEWSRAGYLTLTPGDVIDYGYIKAQFRKLAGIFGIKELTYDKTYAEETTQALEQGVSDDAGNVVEAGCGVKRFVFPQTIIAFADPTAEFERLVIAGQLHHNGHPIMAWQIGHAKVRVDVNSNRRPFKPAPNDYRKIDGVVAAIMSLEMARKGNNKGRSVYDRRGVRQV